MLLDEAILILLGREPFSDQRDLLARLHEEGYELTLSTLSRHMKKLGVRKEAGIYRRVDSPRAPVPGFTLQRVPPCLLVIKTLPGFAQAMAVALDASDLPGLAGTIGGDDTVFVAPKDPSLLESLEMAVRARLEEGV